MKTPAEKHCMRCDAELIEIPREDYVYPAYDDDECSGSIAEFKCPECGTYYSVTGVAEEDKENYPAYNPELEESFVDAHHGYDGLCPMCGSHIVWSGDFMRSEVWGDTEVLDAEAIRTMPLPLMSHARTAGRTSRLWKRSRPSWKSLGVPPFNRNGYTRADRLRLRGHVQNPPQYTRGFLPPGLRPVLLRLQPPGDAAHG